MPGWLIPAVGVALCPLPILAMLLVLGGRRPRAAGSAFWLAWTLGVAGPTIAFVVAAERAGLTEDDSGAIAAAEIVVGIVFVAVGFRLARVGGAVRARMRSPTGSKRWIVQGRAARLSSARSSCSTASVGSD